jgi:hypothetical protein
MNPAQPAQTAEGAPAAPEAPAKPLTPIEQFHPALDPSKVDMVWDEKTGRVKIAPKFVEETPVEESPAEGELPDLGTQHQSIPGGSEATQTSPSNEVAELKGQLAQMTQLVTAMAQAQLGGKPLGEVLGVAQPAQPAEPDYSQVDLYDPSQLAKFIQQNVGAAMQSVMAPHQQTIESARRRQEYDTVAARYGGEPNFNNKAVAAIQLVQENPTLTIDQAYATVSKIQQSLTPPASAPAAQTAQPSANSATRTTLTAEQAQQKAEQAKRLPGQGSGVRGAGPSPMPAHIKGLGQMIAWNLQQASLGN